jgi:hypothetical protein
LGLAAAKRFPIVSAAVARIPLPAFFESDLDPPALAVDFLDRDPLADLGVDVFVVLCFPDERFEVEPLVDFKAELLFPALLDSVEPPEFDLPADCFAPPEAVRFPAAPLLVPVELLDPPRAEDVEALAVPPFEPALLAAVDVFDAPVLELLELFAPELLLEPPVVAVADLPLPLDFEAGFEAVVFLLATDDAAALGFLPELLPDPDFEVLVVFAVAMSMYSRFSEL